MIILNLKKQKVSIVSFLKSGHNLLRSTFKNVFDLHNIKFDEDNQEKYYENVIIITRDPIKRFFSSYYWLDYWRNKINDPDINQFIEKYKITTLSSFIKCYPKIIDDFSSLEVIHQSHYLPQILNVPLKKLNKYEFYKIEDISIKIKENYDIFLNACTDMGKYENKTIDDVTIQNFDFLKYFDEKLNSTFVVYYMFFKQIYDTTHHKKIDFVPNITSHEYKEVCKMFEYEMNLYGYEIEDIESYKFKKSIV